MPIPLLALAAILGVGAAAAVAFWPHILTWAERSLLPWVARNMPSLEGTVRRAFVELDRASTAIRRAARKAWAVLREYLLKETIEFQRNSKSETVRLVTTWIIRKLESGQEKPVKVVTEQEVDREDLPDDVREAFLRRTPQKPIDVIALREKELLTLEATA